MTTRLEGAIKGLFDAVDARDDTVLPILADALDDEEEGSGFGIRRIIEESLAPIETPDGWAWCKDYITDDQFLRLLTFETDYCRYKFYKTRSVAYCVLALVLMEE